VGKGPKARAHPDLRERNAWARRVPRLCPPYGAEKYRESRMDKDRLLAFSDGVIAIIITIMVLELKAPHGADWSDLAQVVPGFLSYVVSFTYVAIYWNNHHHLLYTSTHVNGTILWANMHLLFWLSLIPFATAWSGENNFAPVPTAVYGVAVLMPGCAYSLLQKTILRVEGPDSTLARALGRDLKGKGSIVLYAAAIALAFVNHWVSIAIYLAVALIWLIPDRRIERMFGAA
jgi:TMEM175 potassium channel family protein